MLTAAFAGAAILAGALVRGYSGFGASMFWVGTLSLVFAPATVVPTVLALEVLASLVLSTGVRGRVEWRSMSWLLLGTVVTMPLGVQLLTVLPERPMRVVVALAVLAGTLTLAVGVRAASPVGRGTALVAGGVCGVVNGSTGIGGPPAVLLYFSRATAHDVSRATLIVYFLATDAIGLLMMSWAGLVDGTVAAQAALLAPLAVVGILAGQQLFRRTGGRSFRGVVLGILAVLSLAILVRLALGG